MASPGVALNSQKSLVPGGCGRYLVQIAPVKLTLDTYIFTQSPIDTIGGFLHAGFLASGARTRGALGTALFIGCRIHANADRTCVAECR